MIRGFCLCITCFYVLYGWGALLMQLHQNYKDQDSGLFEKYQQSKWPTRKTPLQEGWSNTTKSDWSSSIRRPLEEDRSTSTKRSFLKEKWIVVVCVSEGFDSMFQNWWVWFRKLNLDMKVFLVAEDYKTMQKYNTSSLLRVHQGIIDRNISSDKGLNFSSNNYNILVSRRAGYILNFLQKNYSTIYSDIDTVWLKDPTPYFEGDFDMWGQSADSAHPTENNFCTGFLAIKPTEASKQFIQEWDLILTKRTEANKPTVNQFLFNELLWKTMKSSNNSLKTMNLPSEQFKTGNDYQFKKPPPTHVVFIHNNWVVGLTNKINRFKASGLWT